MKTGAPDLRGAISMLEQIQALTTSIEGARIGVTVDGTYQDDETVELVKPMVLGLLRQRLRRLYLDLEAQGIRIEAPPPPRPDNKAGTGSIRG